MTTARTQLNTRLSAFTLLEMAVVLVIIGVVIGSGVVMLSGNLQKRQYEETQAKFAVIKKALYDYRTAFNRLPCPADVTLKLSNTNFGVEGATPGTCTGGTPAANFTLATPALPSGASATFVGIDTTTGGAWLGTYGADGYDIAGDTSSYPAYADVTAWDGSNATWAALTVDTRGLIKASNHAERLAARWYDDSTLDVEITDGALHRVTLYVVDWDNQSRVETLSVLDESDDAVLDTQNVSGFTEGKYYTWNVTGHVKITMAVNTGPNAVVSGVFFDTPTLSAIVEGMVPTQTLRLPDEYAFDGWGRRIMYSISKDLTQANAFTLVNADDVAPRITLKDGQPSPIAVTTQAAYALVSFGPNGHGAWPRGNGAVDLDIVTSRINAASANTSELDNCDCDATAVATTFDGTFVLKPPSEDSTNVLNSFDDVVTYVTRLDLALPTE